MVEKRKRGRNNADDLESRLAAHISTTTGSSQIKKRLKKGLSVFFIKNGKLIESKPDKTEVEIKSVESGWVSVEKSNRRITLK